MKRIDWHRVLSYLALIALIVVAMLLVICASKRDVDAAETGFVIRWSLAGECEKFVIQRAPHPDSVWTELATAPDSVLELWDFSVESGFRYWYRVVAVRTDTIETDTGVTYVDRYSEPSNFVTAMEIRFPDTVETFDGRLAEWYSNTDSTVLLVVYPDTTCSDVDVLFWEYMLFMDRVRLQCQTTAPPPPMEPIVPVDGD